MEGDPITKQGALFATTTTDKSGNTYRTITPSAEGRMIITVSAKNMIPYLSQITVKKCVETCAFPVPTCKKVLACLPRIACSSRIASGCLHAIMTCYGSLSPIDPSGHGCPAVDPIDFNWGEIYEHWMDPLIHPEYIYGIWGIRDIGEFIKRADTPDIRKILEEMPVGFRKPVAQMNKRIKNEKRL